MTTDHKLHAKDLFDACSHVNTSIDDGEPAENWTPHLHDLQSAMSHLQDAVKKIEEATGHAEDVANITLPCSDGDWRIVVSIDGGDGEVVAFEDPSSDNSVPAGVRNNLRFHIPLDPYATKAEVDAFVELAKPLAERVKAGFEFVSDDRNNYTGKLSEDAESALDEFRCAVNHSEPRFCHTDEYQVDTLYDRHTDTHAVLNGDVAVPVDISVLESLDEGCYCRGIATLELIQAATAGEICQA